MQVGVVIPVHRHSFDIFTYYDRQRDENNVLSSQKLLSLREDELMRESKATMYRNEIVRREARSKIEHTHSTDCFVRLSCP